MTAWQRIDGSVLGDGGEVTAEALAAYFSEHGVLAVVDRYPAMPQLMGVRVLGNADGRVALLAGDSLASGLEIEELAEDMAVRFDVDVLLGDVTVEEDEEWPAAEEVEGGAPVPASCEVCADGCTCGPDCECGPECGCCAAGACDCGDADCGCEGGACDCFGVPRAAMLASLEAVVSRAQKKAKDKNSNQVSLLAMAPAVEQMFRHIVEFCQLVRA